MDNCKHPILPSLAKRTPSRHWGMETAECHQDFRNLLPWSDRRVCSHSHLQMRIESLHGYFSASNHRNSQLVVTTLTMQTSHSQCELCMLAHCKAVSLSGLDRRKPRHCWVGCEPLCVETAVHHRMFYHKSPIVSIETAGNQRLWFHKAEFATIPRHKWHRFLEGASQLSGDESAADQLHMRTMQTKRQACSPCPVPHT